MSLAIHGFPRENSRRTASISPPLSISHSLERAYLSARFCSGMWRYANSRAWSLLSDATRALHAQNLRPNHPQDNINSLDLDYAFHYETFSAHHVMFLSSWPWLVTRDAVRHMVSQRLGQPRGYPDHLHTSAGTREDESHSPIMSVLHRP